MFRRIARKKSFLFLTFWFRSFATFFSGRPPLMFKQTNKQTLTKKVADMSTKTSTAPVIRWAGFDHVTWNIIMMMMKMMMMVIIFIKKMTIMIIVIIFIYLCLAIIVSMLYSSTEDTCQIYSLFSAYAFLIHCIQRNSDALFLDLLSKKNNAEKIVQYCFCKERPQHWFCRPPSLLCIMEQKRLQM